jgi:ABC-type uncharacterized transport system permease subunit
MKNVGRLLIVAVALLAGGLWTIFQYCTGTSGFNFAWPVDSSRISLNFTTIGTAVWVGVPLIVAGLVLLVIALIGSILMQFLPERKSEYEDSSSKRILTLNE